LRTSPAWDDFISAIQSDDDLLSAGHLGHTTKIDEARDLDSRHTRRDEPANQSPNLRARTSGSFCSPSRGLAS